MRISFCSVLGLSFLFFCSGGRIWGQGTGSLTGTVTDASAAVISRAEVKLTNFDTRAARTTVTADNGTYQFPQLLPAKYVVEISKAGFKTAISATVEVVVGQPTTLNVALEVGAVSQRVEVTSGVAAINTEDASLGTPFGERPIVELPLEGRNIVGLLS